MLLEEKTKSKFGYSLCSLSNGSNNKVCIECDYCKDHYEATYKNRNNSYKKFPKDCCSKCKYKKREDVSMSLYGLKNSAQRDEVREKISAKGWTKTEEFKEKRKKTMIERYGTDSSFGSEEISQKIKKTMTEKYGASNPAQVPEIAEVIKQKVRESKIKNGTIKAVNNKTLPEHAKEIGLSRSFFTRLVKKVGFDKAILFEKRITSIEKSIGDFLESIDVEYKKYQVVQSKRPDFVVNDVIIECDGLRWHSELFVDTNYHKNKMDIYKSNGYKPLFFRSHEIENKFDIVCSIIKNKLGMCKNKIYARKCTIKELDKKDSRAFISENHLMGPGNTTVSYGLYYEGLLVSVLEMKRLKGLDWEISRFCNKMDYSVIGGFSKLLSYFEKNNKFKSIKTFIDLRYGEGSYLTSFGFEECSSNLSFKWTDGLKVYNRMQFPGNSGYENGLCKIWDCGQKKYIKCVY